MNFYLLSVFPALYRPFLNYGLLARAREKGLVDVFPWSLRRFTGEKYGQIDDRAYGGQAGMVMKPEPYFRGVEHLKKYVAQDTPVILTGAGGKKFDQQAAKDLSSRDELIILTGRYEGVDQRVKNNLVDETWSIGSYVTPGGDLPALVLISSIIRQIPGVVGNERSVERDSYQREQLAAPVYTRPDSYRGLEVPEVLLSGDHEKIAAWREQKAHERTVEQRPELLED